MDQSLTELLPRLFGSMAVVLLVMWVAAKLLKDRRLPGVGSPSARAESKKNAVEVVGRQGLGKGATINVIKVGGRTLVLGVTDTNVSLLTELGEPEATAPVLSMVPSESDTQRTGATQSVALATTDQAWKGLLEQVRERTVRHA